MTTIARWITHAAIFAAMTVAPALIAIGLATSAHAQPAAGPNHGSSVSAPGQHHSFPNQHNTPRPGSRIHHHHQHNHR